MFLSSDFHDVFFTLFQNKICACKSQTQLANQFLSNTPKNYCQESKKMFVQHIATFFNRCDAKIKLILLSSFFTCDKKLLFLTCDQNVFLTCYKKLLLLTCDKNVFLTCYKKLILLTCEKNVLLTCYKTTLFT